jgi:uncharacterized protein DUF4202
VNRFDAAAARFEAAHRDDPRTVTRGSVSEPWSVVYHARLASWVDRLAPDASEALRLAARCQHLRRWTIPRESFKEGAAGYKRWRTTLARQHADDAGRVLREAGYDDDVIARVRDLLVKKGLGSDPEVQRFEDAICLTFLENELQAFSAKHAEPKLVDILQKTWKKMSPAGHAAALDLVATLPPPLRALCERALG